MNPVCCNSEMKVDSNGVTVASESNPSWVRSGDRYICRECDRTVVIGFGDAYDAHPHLGQLLING